jgi:hypothetical protein
LEVRGIGPQPAEDLDEFGHGHLEHQFIRYDFDIEQPALATDGAE